MSLTLYAAKMSSASPVMWALAELEVPHTLELIDLAGGAAKRPPVADLNPMGQVPTLVDGDQAMFESSACVIYLGEKFGVERGLWPAAGTPAHMRALTWICWSAATFGPALRAAFADGPGRAEAAARLAELVGHLDRHLAGRPWIADATFSLADVYCSAAIGWGVRAVGLDAAPIDALRGWVERAWARPKAAVM